MSKKILHLSVKPSRDWVKSLLLKEKEKKKNHVFEHDVPHNVSHTVILFSYLSDGPHSLGTSLSEHQPLVTVQILRGLDESEVDWSLVPCP